jgi:hypothetical protein
MSLDYFVTDVLDRSGDRTRSLAGPAQEQTNREHKADSGARETDCQRAKDHRDGRPRKYRYTLLENELDRDTYYADEGGNDERAAGSAQLMLDLRGKHDARPTG